MEVSPELMQIQGLFTKKIWETKKKLTKLLKVRNKTTCACPFLRPVQIMGKIFWHHEIMPDVKSS